MQIYLGSYLNAHFSDLQSKKENTLNQPLGIAEEAIPTSLH